MATLTISYIVPDEKVKGFLDGILDTAGTNAEYLMYSMEIDPEIKHLNIPVEYLWVYDGSNQIDGMGTGDMSICGDSMGCECD